MTIRYHEGIFLNVSRWFTPSPNGMLKRKRISAAMEEQFPLEYRMIYQDGGPAALVRKVRKDENLDLTDAWDKIKRMFND